MFNRYLKIIFLAVFFVSYTMTAYLHAENQYKKVPQAVADAVMQGDDMSYYSGMSKEDLYRIYPISKQKSYYKEGTEEWILFDDILTKDDMKDVIVFYLKNNVVLGWQKKEMPKTPEENFKTVLDRHQKYGGQSAGGGSSNQGGKQKRSVYNPPRINIYRY